MGPLRNLPEFRAREGLLAIRVHSIPGFNKLLSAAGFNPFDSVAFAVDGDQIRFTEYMTTGWQFARDVGSMPLKDAVYNLGGRTNHTLSSLFPIYDWNTGNGYRNLGEWIQDAATQAGWE
jgi:hypothetical protein